MTVKELANSSRVHFNQDNIIFRVYDKTDSALIKQGTAEALPEEIKNRTVISWIVSRTSKGDSISDLKILTR